MRVLVAGATGVIGRQLVPLLTASGHEVVAVSRTDARSGAAKAAGAKVVLADLLDAAAVGQAVRDASPDAIVHVATAIPAALNPKTLAKQFEPTNQLRTVGTRNLIAAAKGAGNPKVIAEGLAYAYDPAGRDAAHEDAKLWVDPPKQFAPVLAALVDMEKQLSDAGGLSLRFGHLYGPGSIYAADGSFAWGVKAGKVPLVGGGPSVFSFTHSYDAATAIAAALDKDVKGVLNVVDDDPARMSEWLPYLAELLGAKKPKGAPAMVAKMAVGDWGIAFMTRLRGADNSRAKRSLGWRPRYASWREGFAAELKEVA
jgi:nucleoside-diphosphate-sugar epimerase